MCLYKGIICEWVGEVCEGMWCCSGYNKGKVHAVHICWFISKRFGLFPHTRWIQIWISLVMNQIWISLVMLPHSLHTTRNMSSVSLHECHGLAWSLLVPGGLRWLQWVSTSLRWSPLISPRLWSSLVSTDLLKPQLVFISLHWSSWLSLGLPAKTIIDQGRPVRLMEAHAVCGVHIYIIVCCM